MIYDYKCDCGNAFEVNKLMSESDRAESCPECGAIAQRHYLPTRGFVKNFEAAYYPTLGKAFTNQKELNYHLDKHNLVAIGNDYGSGAKMYDTFEKDRKAYQEKQFKREMEKG